MASFLGVLGPRLKQASLLWLHGFRDACCLHRVLIYCFSSKQLATRTGAVFSLKRLDFLRKFVLTATGSDADKLITSQRSQWKGAGLGRLPIFSSANYFLIRVLPFFPLKPREQIHDNKAF